MILTQFWTSHVKDEFDLTNSIQTKAEFSYVIAVMYRIGGCNEADDEGSQIGAIFAASMWIYTKRLLAMDSTWKTSKSIQ